MSASRTTIAFIGLWLFTALAAGVYADEEQYSGFLDEAVYGKLQDVELENGAEAKRWLGPRLTLANYQKVLIDDVVLYPEPEPGPQVSAETLDQIRAYLTESLNTKVGSVLNIASEPGPGVVRMQAAVTGVGIKTEGMKAYEVVPVAAVFGGVKALTGHRDREVRVFIEAKFSDSLSGEVVGAVLRQVEGENLAGKKDKLQLQDVEGSLDNATNDAREVLSEMFVE